MFSCFVAWLEFSCLFLLLSLPSDTLTLRLPRRSMKSVRNSKSKFVRLLLLDLFLFHFLLVHFFSSSSLSIPTHDSHSVMLAKEQEAEKLRRALGIAVDHKEGQVCDCSFRSVFLFASLFSFSLVGFVKAYSLMLVSFHLLSLFPLLCFPFLFFFCLPFSVLSLQEFDREAQELSKRKRQAEHPLPPKTKRKHFLDHVRGDVADVEKNKNHSKEAVNSSKMDQSAAARKDLAQSVSSESAQASASANKSVKHKLKAKAKGKKRSRHESDSEEESGSESGSSSGSDNESTSSSGSGSADSDDNSASSSGSSSEDEEESKPNESKRHSSSKKKKTAVKQPAATATSSASALSSQSQEYD